MDVAIIDQTQAPVFIMIGGLLIVIAFVLMLGWVYDLKEENRELKLKLGRRG